MQSTKRETVLALNLIFGLTLIGWPFMATFSLTLFEGSGAANDNYLVLMLVCVWLYPLTYIVALAWSRMSLNHSRTRRRAIRIALLPGLNLLAAVGVTIAVWLHCGGEFAC
ncbi:hypothetical protein [Niveibacterium sp. COAC-50]|uniref:hypothetical protein n=1 Tax=Niveibacterium sp. COAC-50 TaxID=2729384 RepID=UPI001554E4C7|nr:hypothetical protein [Niveibacterium sp. COAC-50]